LLVVGCGQSVAELKKALPDCNIPARPQQASRSLVLPVEVPERLGAPNSDILYNSLRNALQQCIVLSVLRDYDEVRIIRSWKRCAQSRKFW
jgi:hypothetical protein